VSPLGRCDRWYDWVIDVETGGIIQTYQFTAAPTFINDVVLTPTVAWFTDSQQAQLYGVPRGPGGTPGDPDDVITLPLTGDWVQQAGFNANGIAQTRTCGRCSLSCWHRSSSRRFRCRARRYHVAGRPRGASRPPGNAG
jgi:hypothetical protein